MLTALDASQCTAFLVVSIGVNENTMVHLFKSNLSKNWITFAKRTKTPKMAFSPQVQRKMIINVQFRIVSFFSLLRVSIQRAHCSYFCYQECCFSDSIVYISPAAIRIIFFVCFVGFNVWNGWSLRNTMKIILISLISGKIW